jgi:hypothetical protein
MVSLFALTAVGCNSEKSSSNNLYTVSQYYEIKEKLAEAFDNTFIMIATNMGSVKDKPDIAKTVDWDTRMDKQQKLVDELSDIAQRLALNAPVSKKQEAVQIVELMDKLVIYHKGIQKLAIYQGDSEIYNECDKMLEEIPQYLSPLYANLPAK